MVPWNTRPCDVRVLQMHFQGMQKIIFRSSSGECSVTAFKNASARFGSYDKNARCAQSKIHNYGISHLYSKTLRYAALGYKALRFAGYVLNPKKFKVHRSSSGKCSVTAFKNASARFGSYDKNALWWEISGFCILSFCQIERI